MSKIFTALFLGEFGALFSAGMYLLANQVSDLGIEAKVFEYTSVSEAEELILARQKAGYKIILIGYSLGNTTTTWIQESIKVDLLLAIAESTLGENHSIVPGNTKRAVLWMGPDFLSSAGRNDGFNAVHFVNDTHLLLDLSPTVTVGILDEIKKLQEAK